MDNVASPEVQAQPPTEQVATPPVVEPVITTEVKPEVKGPKDGTRFAAMAKKEQRLRLRQEELKKTDAELQTKLAEVKKFEQLRQAAKSNPLAVMEELGLTYDELTNFVINGAQPVNEVKAELERFKAEQVEDKRKSVEAEKARIDAEDKEVIQAFNQEVTEFVKQAGEKFELVNHFGQHQLVIDVIEENYKQNGRVINKEEAADIVEEYLLGEVEKATKTKKWLARQQPVPAVKQPVEVDERKQRALRALEGTQPAPIEKPRTLTNDLSTTQPGTAKLTPQQRRERALARLNGVKF